MRVILLTALLASVATPAIAAPQRDGHFSDRQARAERSDGDRSNSRSTERERSSDRAEARVEARARADQRDVAAIREARQQARAEVRGREDRPNRNVGFGQMREVEAPARVERTERTANWRENEQRRADATTTTEQRERWRRSNDGTRDGRRDRDRWDRDQTRRGDNDRTRWGDRDRTRWSSRDRDDWRNHWRSDRRHDWRDYRRRNRSIFHIGFYTDPFGWGYQRYNVGWQMRPNYYSSRYWISNPAYYRLPYAPPGMQWIRYYDDAVLVDTYTGEIVDVLYNFFW